MKTKKQPYRNTILKRTGKYVAHGRVLPAPAQKK